MSAVIEINAPIDLSDIKDSSDHILDDPVDKNAIKEQKRLAKEQEKEMKKFAKEQEKEMKKQEKEAKKANKDRSDAGLSSTMSAQEARMKIVRYRNSNKFSKFLKESGFKLDDRTLNKLSDEDLEALYEKVQFAVSQKNSERLFKAGVMGVMHGYEYVGQKFLGLNIDGLTAVLNADEQFNDTLEEIMLENQMMVYTKPEWRLIYQVLQTSMMLHKSRAAFDALPEEQKQKIAENIISAQKTKIADTPPIKPEQEKEKPKQGVEIGINKDLEKKFADLLN